MALSEAARVRRFTAPARFEVPALPLAHVPRPGLVDQLEQSTAPLAVVVGSVGAGKTALVSAWARQREGSTVWMACDPTDADPVRFWSALAEAVRRRAPAAGIDALARLDGEGQESVDAAASLATDCGLLPTGGAVVVDDFHLAGTSPAVLAAFVSSLPAGVRVTFASRQDLPFSLARLREQRRVLEIRDRDLGFDLGTARALFDQLDITVDEHDLVRLCERTEGWAAGIHLAALSLAGRPDPAGFVDEFAGTDQAVADFLVNEVLDQQSPEVVDFLTATSVLEFFDAPLCEAVTGRADAAAVLADVQAAHLFVTEVDHRTGWFRYHHLFRSFLRARLRMSSPERYRDAHAAASRALVGRGDVMGAVEHAMSADDVDGAFELVRALALSHLDFERRTVALDTMRAWLRRHGGTVVDEQPRLVVECCLFLSAIAAPDDIDSWLRRVERSSVVGADAPLAALVEATWGFHLLQEGDPEAALARITEALRLVGDDPGVDPWLTQWTNVSCPAHSFLDDTDAVRREVDASRATSASLPVLDSVRLPGHLAWAAAVDGDLDEAERQAVLALLGADDLDLPALNFGRVLPLLARAAVAAERDDLDDAAKLTSAALDAAEAAHRRFLLLPCLLQQARLHRSLGDVESALAGIEAARQVAPGATRAVTDHIDRLAAGIALAVGNPRAATLVADLSPTPFRALLEARLLLDQGDGDGAAAVLDDAEPRMGSRRSRVEHGLLRARAFAPTDRDRAMEHLGAALHLARPVGMRRTIIDEGAEVHELLEAFPADPALDPFVAGLLEAVYRRPVVRRAVGPGLVDGLSTREHEVLRFLASRLSYSEMAAALFISVNTLKTHLKAVYRKLGVSTRAEAVQAARRSGLL